MEKKERAAALPNRHAGHLAAHRLRSLVPLPT
jgi:hypothetical protein